MLASPDNEWKPENPEKLQQKLARLEESLREHDERIENLTRAHRTLVPSDARTDQLHDIANSRDSVVARISDTKRRLGIEPT